jgi:hypothetical protein
MTACARGSPKAAMRHDPAAETILNALEEEKAKGRAGQIAESLTKLELRHQ